MVSGIYKIINKTTKKFYIGSAVNLHKRKVRHWGELRGFKHHNKHLQNAWKKYGEEDFIFKVVRYVAVDKLFDVETRLLQKHVGKEYCYNIGSDARAPSLGKVGKLSPTWGLKATEEARRKRSNARKGKKLSEQHKEKISQGLRGKSKTKEHREKLSLIKSGVSNPWYGVPKTEAFKEAQKERLGTKVLVVTEKGGSVVYKSIKDVKRAIGMSLPVIKRALRSGKKIQRGLFMGYSVSEVGKTVHVR